MFLASMVGRDDEWGRGEGARYSCCPRGRMRAIRPYRCLLSSAALRRRLKRKPLLLMVCSVNEFFAVCVGDTTDASMVTGAHLASIWSLLAESLLTGMARGGRVSEVDGEVR